MAENAQLQGIEFEIKGNADSAAKSLSRFSDSLRKVNNAADRTGKLQKLANSLKDIVSALDKVDGSGLVSLSNALNSMSENEARLGNVVGYMSALSTLDFSNLTTAATAIQAISQNANAVSQANTGNQNNGGAAPQQNSDSEARVWRDVLSDLASTERMTTEASSALAYGLDGLRIGLVAVLDGALSVVRGLGRLAATVGGSLLNGLKNAGSAALKFARNLAVAPFQRAIDGAKNFAGKLGQVVSSFKRILFYRVIRSVIKEIGQALQEGSENAYWFSKNIGNSTKYIAEAYDSLTGKSYTLGNQMGAAWATLYAQIAPVIERIIALLTRAMAVIAQFFSVLGGRGTYMKAIDYSKDWADATAKGAGSAKEWKNQLMGFDEINRLEEPSSGGGGGGSALHDYENMFEEANVESKIADFANSIKQAIRNGDWQGLGTLLGDKINSIFPSAAKWKEWGGKIGNALKGVINSAYYTLKTADFAMFGTRIADFFNSALSKALSDEGGGSAAENLGRLLMRKTTMILDLLLGGIKELDWALVGQAIGDFFIGAISEASEWIGSQDWSQIGATLWHAFETLIENIDFESLAESFFSFLGAALGAAAAGIGAFFDKSVQAIKDYFRQKTEEAGGDAWEGFKKGIKDAWSNVTAWCKEHIVDPFVNGVKDLLGIHSPSTVFASIGTNVVEGLWNGIQNKWSGFLSFFQGLWNDLKTWWGGLRLGAFHIPRPVFSWGYTQASGLIAEALKFVGLPATIPHLNISWMAKGGVIDGTTLIGAGEAGKEAIIPLERNTEWISKVAAEMNAQQARQASGNNGSDLGAALEDANDGVINAIFAVGAQVVQAIAESGSSGNIDWRQVSQQVTKYQRQMARANG